MQARINNFIQEYSGGQVILKLWGLLILLSLLVAVISETYVLAGLPLLVLVIFIAVVDFKKLFFLLLALIPLSTEVNLPGGFGTDIPTEPLMLGLMLVLILWAIRHYKLMNFTSVFHPLFLLLMLHIGWIYASTISSDLFFVSFKYALSKTWYLFAFFFFSLLVFQKVKDFQKAFWCIFIPLILTILITLIRHAAIGFSFEFVHTVFHPFHRNHVSYSALLSLFFPILVMALSWYSQNSWRWWILILAIPVFLIGIYFAYTRAGYIALLIAAASFWIIKYKMIRIALLGALIVGILGVTYFINDNKYLDYAPNYDTTVSHTEFDNLLEATYKGEDISTMERVYRWIAGFNMVGENPILGVGPGNFINFYKAYTVTSFKTYVSDNEDRSGIHSYYLMTAVEQGLTGLIIFLLLCAGQLIIGERVYHQTKEPIQKSIIMAVLLCSIVIHSFQIINDMLETDKMGPFFFISLAIIINVDLQNKVNRHNSNQAKAQKDS